jgi:hypothetical protein
MSEFSNGIIYVASGTSYIEEACQSARSVKKHMPNMPITLFTHTSIEDTVFDDVVLDERLGSGRSPKEGKVGCLSRSPYDRTLYLDTDTYVCTDICDIFTLLDTFDLAVAHDPARLYYSGGEYPSNLPESFPELNTGVILYKNTSKNVVNLLSSWKEKYGSMCKEENERDQISFREVLYNSNVRMTVLTPEYNCRFGFPLYLDGPVKIIHGHLDRLTPNLSYSEVEKILNKGGGVYEDGIHRRVFQVQSGRLSYPWPAKPSIPARFWQTVVHTIKIIKNIIYHN